MPPLRELRIALAAASALSALPAVAQEAAASLETQFKNPPQSARPRVWWHWMNGNVTEDGIAKDLAWMKRIGIGGVQNFDADMATPQIVDKRLVYMTPEWKQAFRFAVREADRLGLELTIAASPGWSETGGPWVPPADGLKKLVWSETLVEGGSRVSAKLPPPPTITGPFQTMRKQQAGGLLGPAASEAQPQLYSDIAVFAVPALHHEFAQPTASLSDGKGIDAATLIDDNLESGIKVPRGTAAAPASLRFDYAAPQTIRSATLFLPGMKTIFAEASILPVLESSDEGQNWRRVADIPVREVPTTASFAPVTARHFRVILNPSATVPFSLGDLPAGTVMGDMVAAMAAGPGGAILVSQFTLSSDSRIDQFETKAGFALARDYYALGGPDDALRGVDPANVIDLTSRMRADGTVIWTPPRLPGGQRWKVLRLGASLLGTTNHPAPKEATGLEVDKFDGAAVRRYLEHYIGMYRDASGGMLGARGVQAILTDSIEVGAANWTPRMAERFEALRGYDPTPWLPALAGVVIGNREQSDRFLFDYRRTLADLMASEHYGTVAKVAHEHGLKVYGEALEDRRPSLGDDMAMRRHADIPMAAMWTYGREAGPKATYLADMKGAASVAHIYGQNLVAAESLTAPLAFWSDSPASLRRIIDLEFVTGVNRPVIHTSVHQPRDDKFPGLSLSVVGQYFTRHETWAEMAKPWIDYIARNSLMLQQGRHVADVAYFYGEEAPLTSLYGSKPVADAPKTSAYDFVNADALADALKNDGSDLVTPGGARYRLLYLGGSSSRMSLATLRRIAALAEGGGTIVGMAPIGDPGLASDPAEYAALIKRMWPGAEETRIGQGRVIAGKDVETALRRIGVAPDFRFSGQDGADVPFLHRQLADGDSWFLVNRKNRPETIEAYFRVSGKAPELWHADTGQSEPISYRIEKGETIVPLTLGAEQSVHVVFRKPANSDALVIPREVPVSLARIDGPWAVALQRDRGAPAATVMPKLSPLDETADAGIKYFSGIATYTTQFSAPRGWKQGQTIWLDLGDVREIAEVSLNGKPVGTAWHRPFRLDVGQAMKRGRNSLEVRVANLWVNRLIGDAQPGAQKITFTAVPTYKATAPLRPSGLIGPVQLIGAKAAGATTSPISEK